LVSKHPLGYISGEQENGPNEEKKQFLSTGRRFLSALGRDLGFSTQKVITNKAGIACSGEIYLRGIWDDVGTGIKIELTQNFLSGRCIHYTPITSMEDRTGGYKYSCSLEEFQSAQYGVFLLKFLDLKENRYDQNAA